METSPVTCRTLEDYYHINANTFDRQYKDVLSGFRTWAELDHADEWLVFPDNIGPHLAIDETSLSNGELYTVVTNRDRHGRDRCLVAIVRGVRSETVIKGLKVIPDELLDTVGEVTLDLSESMKRIVRTCFPKAMRVIDRFHIQKLACDAVQEMRIKHRWDAIQEANDAMESAKLKDREYVPLRYKNGDTKKELLAKGAGTSFFKSGDKWTVSRRQRAEILFREFPRSGEGLRAVPLAEDDILQEHAEGQLRGCPWHAGTTRWRRLASAHSRSLLATFRERYNDILNFYVNRSSNSRGRIVQRKDKSHFEPHSGE
ncbi:MAG: transposase [Porphyromonadaceae bacterium]|nr:MAG: transposase [Porphyromonadaceae bacterium]